MRLPAVCVLVASTACVCVKGAAPPSVTINWVSDPLRAGEIGMIAGGGFSAASKVTLTDSSGKAVVTAAIDATDSALKFAMPAAAQQTVYDVSVDGSAPYPINVPDVWWWQGDNGNVSTPSGWLRVFGRALAPPSATTERDASELTAALEAELLAAAKAQDFERAQELVRQLAGAELSSAALTGSGTQIRLTPVSAETTDTSPITLSAVAANTTEFHALFEIPSSMTPGKYKAEISSGTASKSAGEWFALSMFESPTSTAVSHVTIEAPRVWKSDVFTVDCEWSKPIFERPCGWVGARSSKQVDDALAKAKANGGGVVMLPRGQYYVDGPLIVPEGTRLVGEGTNLVSIFFREDNPDTAPRPGYIHANNSATAWAVEDLSVYVTHYYYSVFYVQPTCKDWTLKNVRVRAVAWAMISDPVLGNNGRGGRLANFSRGQVGEVIYLDGNTNYKIVENDLLATGIVIHTGGHGFNNGGSAMNGIVARNTLWNANAAHWFDDIKQVIFEWNRILPGGAEMSWGNNIDNYSGGYCQHVYHANNHFQNVWAGDREVMTFDPVLGDYFGGVTCTGTKCTLSTSGTGSANAGSMGGMVSILAGTGAGQYRRLIGIDSTKAVITIDEPFTTALDTTSMMQLGPFKGRFIFDQNRYEDCGAFQLYANAADVIVSRHKFARAEGLLSWGRATGGHVYAPNIRVQFVDNVIEEGNHMWNWNATYPYPHPKTIEPYAFATVYSIGILASDQDPQPCEPYPHGAKNCKVGNGTAFQGAINHLIVLKRNVIENNGGIEVRGHTTNVVVEGNIVRNSSVGIHVNTSQATHVYVHGNDERVQ